MCPVNRHHPYSRPQDSPPFLFVPQVRQAALTSSRDELADELRRNFPRHWKLKEQLTKASALLCEFPALSYHVEEWSQLVTQVFFIRRHCKRKKNDFYKFWARVDSNAEIICAFLFGP